MKKEKMPNTQRNPEPEADQIQNARSMRPNSNSTLRSQIERLTNKVNRLEKRASAQFGEISEHKVKYTPINSMLETAT